MESIKNPQTLWNAANTVGVLSLFFYFYKRDTMQEAKIEDLEAKIRTLTLKSDNIIMNYPSNEYMRKAIADCGIRMQEQIKTGLDEELLTLGEDADYLLDSLDVLVESLKDKEIPVALPKRRRAKKS